MTEQKGRIRVVSDGSPHGTTIIDLDSGAELKGVQEVDINISARHGAQITLQMLRAEVEIEGKVTNDGENDE